MSENKHTPGPWLRDNLTIYTLRPCKWLGHDSMENAWTAYVMPNGQHKIPLKELEANARLIAAAPELLEALEWIESNPFAHRANMVGVATAAIAKAKGTA
jgi:hypothetical protein